MVGVGREVGFPKVFEIVIVGCRSATLDLRDDTPSWTKAKEEVWSCLSDETALRCKDHLLPEAHLEMQELGEVSLHGRALGSVDVNASDLVASVIDVFQKPPGQLINRCHFTSKLRRDGGFRVPSVAIHARSFARSRPMS